VKNLIQHLAQLAALEISDSEVPKYQAQLTDIFEHMDQIKQLDLAAIAETFRTTEEENVLRDDIVTPSLSQAEALQNASLTHDGFFVVPSVMKDKDAT